MQKPENDFDYIIVGAGCAGLSLVVRMIESAAFRTKKILVIDKAPGKDHHKTWCFWDKGKISSFWEKAGIIHHQWSSLWLRHPLNNILLDIDPYRYKMIRGEAFFKYCFDKIKSSANVELLYAAVTDMDEENGMVTTADATYTAPVIFSSVLANPPLLKPNELYLLQHFHGWWIETAEDVFDASAADLMNFKTGQQHGCTFLYVLPVTPRRALIEYTLFTAEELDDEQYDEGLKQFISKELCIENYEIKETEHGVIPMTDLKFPQQKGKVFYIGTAGGQTKASTGYTFSFIQKQAEAIVQSIDRHGAAAVFEQSQRFRFYDSVLLKVLYERKIKGADVFFSMFKKNKASRVLRFLDNESSFLDEIKIMNTTNWKVFIPASIKKMLRM